MDRESCPPWKSAGRRVSASPSSSDRPWSYFGLLARAARTLPIGTPHAIWVGVGVVGSAIGGAVLFDEPRPPLRVAFVVLLLVAIAGLKMTSGAV